MKKIIIAFIMFFTITVNADNIELYSKNAIVINLNDNKVLYEKNSDEQVYIASLTKIATAIVAIENIDNFDEQITITEEMLSGIYEYSKAGLQVGDIVTYEDILYGIILPSGADCVQVIEQQFGGRVAFSNKMNELVQKLNLETTHFSNGIGMDTDNYSSVSDMAKLLKYALKNETFYKIYTTKTYTMTNGLVVNATVEHYDTLDTSLITGSKTGYTNAAGFCISAIYKSDEYNYLIVTANADYTLGQPTHIMDALTIINYYLDNYHYLKLYDKNELILSVPIINSGQKNYDIKAQDEIKLFVKKEIQKEDLTIDLKQVNTLTSYNKKGDYLGTISVKYQDNILYTKDMYLDNNIKYKININSILIIILLIFMCLLMIYNVLLRKKIHRLIIKLKIR